MTQLNDKETQKPCPFCECSLTEIIEMHGHKSVSCLNCGATGPYGVKDWNRRPAIDQLATQLADRDALIVEARDDGYRNAMRDLYRQWRGVSDIETRQADRWTQGLLSRYISDVTGDITHEHGLEEIAAFFAALQTAANDAGDGEVGA